VHGGGHIFITSVSMRRLLGEAYKATKLAESGLIGEGLIIWADYRRWAAGQCNVGGERDVLLGICRMSSFFPFLTCQQPRNLATEITVIYAIIVRPGLRRTCTLRLRNRDHPHYTDTDALVL
jgi:hypothetical protein